MAAYNAEKTIGMAIRSVLAQTYTDWELLVADDCSDDDTPDIVGGFADSRIRYIRLTRNTGISGTRLRALREAKGEWIAVLDSDDMWEPDKLEKQMRLQAQTGAELLFTGSAFMDEDGNRKRWIMHVPATVDYRRLLKQNLISNSSTLVRRDLYEKYYVSEDNMHEDYALWLTLLSTGLVAYGVDEPLLVYRVSPASMTGNKAFSALMNWKTLRYLGLSFPKAVFCELCYSINGIRKYRAIHRRCGKKS